MMLRPQNHAWAQSHPLMKALLEAMLLYKHQLLYDPTYYDTMHKALYPRDDIHRLVMWRKKEEED